MRVLFVNENIGGHASVHTHLRRALVDHPDVEADFIDVPPPSGLRRAVGTRVPGLGRLDLDLQSLRAQLALSRWVRRRILLRLGEVGAAGPRYDALHVYTQNAGLRSADIIASMPSVVSTDSTNVLNAYRLPYREATRFTPWAVKQARRFEQPVWDAATLVVANTAWVAESIRDDYGVGDDRLRTYPFGITAPDLGDGPAPGTVAPQGLPQIVFVGRQLGRKGALRLHRLHQEHLADVAELVLVTTEEVPPGRNVRAVHDVTVGSGRLWEVLRAGAIFCFPSTIDQAPNAVIEAMCAGLPVVGLELSAMPEMVPPECGRLVARDDDAGLVRVLRELIDDPALRARMGQAGRERFATTYDAKASTARLVATLAEARERFAAASADGAGPGPRS
ncbi:glycosyltransferase family 4 protein [Nocardioides sp. C4-1]|uniref:glycosyltransferase family 4 protein n=1 Tax=Nocardioides sp. C4-1 TaxID=3151851 RepID=UPI003264095C